jgi:hypothetical protein
LKKKEDSVEVSTDYDYQRAKDYLTQQHDQKNKTGQEIFSIGIKYPTQLFNAVLLKGYFPHNGKSRTYPKTMTGNYKATIAVSVLYGFKPWLLP